MCCNVEGFVYTSVVLTRLDCNWNQGIGSLDAGPYEGPGQSLLGPLAKEN